MKPQQQRRASIHMVEKVTRWIGSVPSLILHTLLFITAFLFGIFGFASWAMVLLVLTTAVSLEAIYLALFIQMTVNEHTDSLREVQEDIDEIEGDIDEIQEDVEEIHDDDEREEVRQLAHDQTLRQLQADMQQVLTEIQALKNSE